MSQTANSGDAEISLLFYDDIIKLDKIDIRAKKEKKQITIRRAKDLYGKIRTDTISIEVLTNYVVKYLRDSYIIFLKRNTSKSAR
jgi:hypothetical protein